MSETQRRKDLVDMLSNFLAQNKGLPVFAGAGLALLSLVLSLIPGLGEAAGFGGWLVRHDVLLHLGVIVGLLGVLVGDAL